MVETYLAIFFTPSVAACSHHAFEEKFIADQVDYANRYSFSLHKLIIICITQTNYIFYFTKIILVTPQTDDPLDNPLKKGFSPTKFTTQTCCDHYYNQIAKSTLFGKLLSSKHWLT